MRQRMADGSVGRGNAQQIDGDAVWESAGVVRCGLRLWASREDECGSLLRGWIS